MCLVCSLKSWETILGFESEQKRQPWEGPEKKSAHGLLWSVWASTSLSWSSSRSPLSGCLDSSPTFHFHIFVFMSLHGCAPPFISALSPSVYMRQPHEKTKEDTLEINSMKEEFTVSAHRGAQKEGGHSVIHSQKCDSCWVSQVMGRGSEFYVPGPQDCLPSWSGQQRTFFWKTNRVHQAFSVNI